MADITIKGQQYLVSIEGDLLKVTVGGQEALGKTIPDLIREATKLAAIPKVAIPIMTIKNPDTYTNQSKDFKFETGELTGIHSSNGNLLVRWQGAKTTTQEGTGYGKSLFLPMTAEEKKELLRLYTADEAARKAYEAFLGRYRVREELARKLVAQAVKALDTTATPVTVATAAKKKKGA